MLAPQRHAAARTLQRTSGCARSPLPLARSRGHRAPRTSLAPSAPAAHRLPMRNDEPPPASSLSRAGRGRTTALCLQSRGALHHPLLQAAQGNGYAPLLRVSLPEDRRGDPRAPDVKADCHEGGGVAGRGRSSQARRCVTCVVVKTTYNKTGWCVVSLSKCPKDKRFPKDNFCGAPRACARSPGRLFLAVCGI